MRTYFLCLLSRELRAVSQLARSLFCPLFLLLSFLTTIPLAAQEASAPGRPGNDAHWRSAAKQGIGTATSRNSKVWFTLAEGVLTEVFYPTVDEANVESLQLAVFRNRTRLETEIENTVHKIELLDSTSLSFRQVNVARDGSYRIAKTYTTDPRRNTVLIDVQFDALSTEPFDLYVVYDPSIANSGMHDSGWDRDRALIAGEGHIFSALVTEGGFADTTSGYSGTSGGLDQLRREGRLRNRYTRADDGNVVQVGRIERRNHFTLVLGFGETPTDALLGARASLTDGFNRAQSQYIQGWREYIRRVKTVEPRFRRQFNVAAMVLKAHEDKTYLGASVASLSAPWGGGPNANERAGGGYHTVWARDLYHVATAQMALGDDAAANRALDYLFQKQQKSDGSFPQNSWVDGRQVHDGLQMDQVAYPLILAWELGRTDRQTWTDHIKRAADFLLKNGPSTGQERWEEESGYSPSTIAAEIAGLVCAASIARSNGAVETAAKYLNAADDWVRNVDRWTATSTGKLVNGKYYIRVSRNQDPGDGEPLEINSGGGTYDEREIVDVGFLELVRLGIKPTDDPLVKRSIAVVDATIRVETPNGPAWYRYNHDAYGETLDGSDYDAKHGIGRLWTLLTGERGEYELAAGNRAGAEKMLEAMALFANDGLMIPEQVWDRKLSKRAEARIGEGTGSATPLAWSMAQFVRLAMNLNASRNLDTPSVVSKRYATRPPSLRAGDTVLAPLTHPQLR